MSARIKCDKCGIVAKSDTSGDKLHRIGIDGSDGYTEFRHLCGQCLRLFYSDFLGWEWNEDEGIFVPKKNKIKDYVDTTVGIAEQERKRKNRLEFDDVAEFCKVKEGKKDVIRTPKAYLVGDVIEICYDGFAYKDSVKCKVTGCHKAASAGYIIELINL